LLLPPGAMKPCVCIVINTHMSMMH
jgi:hypothetical protein